MVLLATRESPSSRVRDPAPHDWALHIDPAPQDLALHIEPPPARPGATRPGSAHRPGSTWPGGVWDRVFDPVNSKRASLPRPTPKADRGGSRSASNSLRATRSAG